MFTTPHPEAQVVLEFLLEGLRGTLGEGLVGVYPFGSLVHGGFEPERSDLDLLVILVREVDDATFAALDVLHSRTLERFPAWRERLELKYLSSASLQVFRTQPYPIAFLCPGEPFHRFEGGRRYLMNLYEVQQGGVRLHGPPIETLMPGIARAEFVAVVRGDVEAWPGWMQEMHTWGGVGYGLVTLCRALYTCTTGEQTSKEGAMHWAAGVLPEHATLLERGWAAYQRNDPAELSEAERAGVQGLVAEVLGRVRALEG